jgi:hypothetical protein
MKNHYWAVLVLAALPPAAAVAATGHHMAGAGCLASYNSGSFITRGPNMINWDSNGVNVACPFDLTSTGSSPVTVNPAGGRVDYMDANISQSVQCQLSLVETTNTIVSSAWRYSCSTPSGGCTGNTETSYLGNSFLTLPDDIGSTTNVVGMTVNCYVPSYDVNWGASGLTGASMVN